MLPEAMFEKIIYIYSENVDLSGLIPFQSTQRRGEKSQILYLLPEKKNNKVFSSDYIQSNRLI